MLDVLARIFTDRSTPPVRRTMPTVIPNLIPPDQSRSVAERLDATDRVIEESKQARIQATDAAVQFAQAVRETATGILGGDLMGNRIGRIPGREGR